MFTKVAYFVVWPWFLYCSMLVRYIKKAIVLYLTPPKDAQDSVTILERAGQRKPKLHISWPGLGIFFWWQLGVLKNLQERFDLSKVPMLGSSAGSFIAAFAACGSSPDAIYTTAYALCDQHNAFSRPLGLLGIWGQIVREWLQHLLPPDAAPLCSANTSIVINGLPTLTRDVVSYFDSKQVVVEACLASAHIPFFLDLRPWSKFQGRPCVDGGFRYVVLRRHADLWPAGAPAALLMDARKDSKLMASFGLQQCVSCLSPQGVKALMQRGYEYAEELHQAGVFDQFDLEGICLERGSKAAAARSGERHKAGLFDRFGVMEGTRVGEVAVQKQVVKGGGQGPLTISLVASSEVASG